ncbi:hypothetical protein MHYP_G00293250 [Metynnis hypsauchen]
MLRFVAFLLCATAACAVIMPKIGFKLDEIKGKWYLIGFATDASWFVNHKDRVKMGLALLEPKSDGDLDVAYTKLE